MKRLGCTCDRIRKGESYSPDQCGSCWMFWHNRDFNLARGGDGQIAAAIDPAITIQGLIPVVVGGVVQECRFEGDSVCANERSRRHLDHRKRWKYCLNPDKPLGEIVCGCQGCGPACPGYDPESDNQTRTVAFSFKHGIGDATNLAHMIPLYRRRGYRVQVHSGHADHGPLFAAAGAEIVNGGKRHAWPHAPMPAEIPAWPRPWERNKNGFNLSRRPLPDIGAAGDLWSEYLAESIDFDPQVTQADRARVDAFLPSGPIITLHFRGFDWADGQGRRRNYPEPLAAELVELLLRRTDAVIVDLDREGLSPPHPSPRVRYLSHFGLGVLYEVLKRSAAFAGIDSGPLNFVRLTSTPAVGIWNCHYPADFILPREQTVNVVPIKYAHRDKWERFHWNTILAPELDQPSPQVLADTIMRILGRRQYLKIAARDVQLQSLVDRTNSNFRADFDHSVDRHMSFALALRHLATIQDPVAIETGTIRAEEDWSGAGFSTYLFAAFIHQHGGEFHSVDLTPERVVFAKEWTREFSRTTIHERHSHDFLADWSGRSIDLFYSDSADTDSGPGYQECCLEEVKRALPLLATNARILIDDTPPSTAGGWLGKGGLAVPWLLDQGWSIEYSGWQTLLRKS